MRHILRAGLPLILLLLNFTAQAQLNVLFAPFDCREHREFLHEDPLIEIVIRDTFLIEADRIPTRPATNIDVLEEWRNWSLVENYSFGKDRGSLPMINDLNSLHPFFRDKIVELIKQCQAKGIKLAVVETYRTHAKQKEYKRMGKKYTASGAGQSKHQYGLAIDVVPTVNSIVVWDNMALWRKIGFIGERLGLRWGGRWRDPYDPGHFEWTGGLNSSHLAAGKLPTLRGFEEHYPCLEEDLTVLRRYWKEWETSQSSLTRK
jgi:hypothetical protein